MAWNFVRVVVGEFATRIGWFLLLCGLILPGMQAFDTLTATEATATVVEIRTVCSKQVSSKSWRKFSCDQQAEVEAAGTAVRTQHWAKLAFSAPDGRARSAWANFGKLEIKEAAVGQQLQILYRGDYKKPYVARPFDWKLAGIGFAVSFAGLVLLLIARSAKRAASPPTAAPPRPAERRQPVPTPVPQQQPVRAPQAATIPLSQASPRPAYVSPGRRSSVERNRGWFG